MKKVRKMKFEESLRKVLRGISRFLPEEEVKPKKVAILIDGENFHKSLQLDLSGTEIGDFEEFKNRLLDLVKGRELAQELVYYTSVGVDTKNPERILRLFSLLAKAGFAVKSKPLPKGKEPKSEIDPLIAVGICRSAINRDVSALILVSGDRHFIDAVVFAKEMGKKIIVVSTEESLSEELKKVSDQWVDLKNIIGGITQKSKIEKKREEALKKLNEGKKIILSTFKENQ